MRSNIFLACFIVLLLAVFLFRKAPLSESQIEPVQTPVSVTPPTQVNASLAVPPTSAAVSQPADPLAAQKTDDLHTSMAEALRRDDDGLVKEVNPDGSLTVHLQGRFQHAPTATVNPDGSVSYGEL